MIAAVRIVLVCAMALLCYPAHPQGLTLSFHHLTIDQGLSQNNAMFAFMDSKGFVWIGTEDGLNRFDGYGCRVYRNIPADPHSLSNNLIRNAVEDNEGTIWFSTQHGISRYSYRTDRFTRLMHDPTDPNSIIANGVQWVYIDSQQRLWAVTEEGITLKDLATQQVRHITHDPKNPNSLAGNLGRRVIEDRQGRFWIATFNGLSMYVERTGSFTNFRHIPGDPLSLSSNRVQTVFEDSRGRIWVGTFDQGLNLLDEATGTFTRFPANLANPASLPNPLVNSIAEGPQGVIWVGTSGGISRFNEGTRTFTSYIMRPNVPESLTSTDITQVYFDPTGAMWLSTRFGGVNVYDPGRRRFTHFKRGTRYQQGLSGSLVTSFAEDADGSIWVGVDGGGVNRFDRRTGRFTHIQADPRRPQGLTSDKVLALMMDSRGLLWIGMWGGGVNVYNPRTQTFTHYLHQPGNPSSLPDNNVFYIFEDSHGYVWVATWGNGLGRFDRATGMFRHYAPQPGLPNGLPASGAVMITEDHLGNLWIPHEGAGLTMYNRATDSFERFVYTGREGDISNEALFSVFEDSQQRLWVGTNGGGLCLFNRDTRTFTVYRTADGLPNDVILGILEDDQGRLWLSTNHGLSRFDPETVTFRNFDASDGLQSNQFSRWAFQRLSTGELLFGGVNGFNLFHPEQVIDNPRIPPVYITDFKLFNEEVPIGPESVLRQSILTTPGIALRYSQNVISFEFTALNFRQAERNQYKYMLEGFNDTWINLRNERRVSFTNLDPGHYTLRVIASNNDGVWNEEGVSLSIRVTPPFWRTWWFYSLLVGAITLLIALFISQRERVLRRDKALLEESLRQGERELAQRMGEIEQQRLAILEKDRAEAALKWHNAGLAEFSSLINKHKESLEVMSRKLIHQLVRYVGANMGGLYIVADQPNGAPACLEMVSYYAPDDRKLELKQIMMGEGNVGAACAERRPIIIDNLPDGYAKFTSGLGQIPMRHLAVIPAVFDQTAMGVLEILSAEKLEAYKLELIAKVGELLASSLITTKAAIRANQLLEEMQRKAELMAAQEEELRQNLEEITTTQEELERQQVNYSTIKAEFQAKEQQHKEELAKLKKQLTALRKGTG